MTIIDFESRKRDIQKKRGLETELKLSDKLMSKDTEDFFDDDSDDDIFDYFLSSYEDEYSYVYELELELVGSNLKNDDLTDEQKKALAKFAKVKNSLSRTVLVTGHTLLWQLHYIIQQAFGWNDSHLHRFALPEASFAEITNNSVKTWGELCGIIFRYPDGNMEDLYWYDNDDYGRKSSLKHWFREKYTTEEEYLGEGDHYYNNQKAVEDLLAMPRPLKLFGGKQVHVKQATIDELRRGLGLEGNINTILTRLPVGEVFTLPKHVPSYKAWRESMKSLVTAIVNMHDKNVEKDFAMFERVIRKGQELMEKYCDEYGEFKEGVPYKLQEELTEELDKASEAVDLRNMLLEALNPMVHAFTDSLVYYYDYGDDWEVRVTCKNVYCAEEMEGEEAPAFIGDEDKEVSAKLYDAVHAVSKNKNPLCIATDGVNVVDDIGGLYGFCEFLEDYNSEDEAVLAEAIEFAKEMKWKGRKPSPKALL